MSRKKFGAIYFCLLAGGLMDGAPAWSGTIKGVVRSATEVLDQKTLPVTIDHYICGQNKPAEDLILSPDKGVRNAVVSIQNPPPGGERSGLPTTVRIDQKQCVFVPRVVIVPVGGTVEFLNSDRLLHNLHSISKENPTFNRAQPGGRTIPIVFRKPEIIRVDCNLHSWMRAWVVVTDHPFYAVTGEQGEFTLDNVPQGTYTLQVWQESLGTVRTEVTVGNTGSTIVRVEMPTR